MSKELDEFYKKYSARIIAVDDPPVKVMNGGKFKLLSIEEYDNLKQQLAEKDQAIESLEELNRSLGQTCNNDKKEIERLNKEIEKVEKTYMKQRDYYTKEFNEVIDNLKQQLAEKEKEIDELQQSQNQTAIVELEKAKEFAKKNKFVVSDYHNLDLAELNYGICFETLCKQIDQQIKKLKE